MRMTKNGIGLAFLCRLKPDSPLLPSLVDL